MNLVRLILLSSLLSGCKLFLLTLQEVGNCDDGLDNDDDGLADCDDDECSAEPSCLAVCGNGVVEPGETCDDGGLIDGDGCSSQCILESCGDGVVDVGEGCDDANANNNDGCLDSCQVSVVCDGNAFAFGQKFQTDARSGSCFVFSSNQSNFNAARNVCINAGGDVASIVDQQEMDIVTALVAGTEAWIGLSDSLAEGSFVWVDGEAFAFNGFGPGEPNNSFVDNPIDGEDCVVSRFDAIWIDVSCEFNRRVLCEFRP